MSEEEAIERLKERVKLDRKIRNNKIESDYEQFCENECQAIETILNLADKQHKEIEKLNFENHMIKKWNKQLDTNCISKDKIREKIEHYNNELEHIKNGEEFENEKPMYYWGKVALEELLEENNND